MDIHGVVKKLVGPINPVGETNTDNARFENLKVLTELVEKLVIDIDAVAYEHKDAHQFSLKRAAEHASKFMKDKLGIVE